MKFSAENFDHRDRSRATSRCFSLQLEETGEIVRNSDLTFNRSKVKCRKSRTRGEGDRLFENKVDRFLVGKILVGQRGEENQATTDSSIGSFGRKFRPGNVESRDCDSSVQKVGKVEKGAELIARGSMSGERSRGIGPEDNGARGNNGRPLSVSSSLSLFSSFGASATVASLTRG